MEKMVKVAIVGFPNVGKSTLFNRLLKEKRSLVHSLPGMTRDQVSAHCSLKRKEFVLVDTGGFFDFQEDPLSSKIKKRRGKRQRTQTFFSLCWTGKGAFCQLKRSSIFL